MPEYDHNEDVLLLNSNTQATAGSVVPPETALIVSGSKAVNFEFTAEAPTWSQKGVLSGSSLMIYPSEELTILTFGVGKTGPNKGKYGFYRFTGTTLNPGLCYLVYNPIENPVAPAAVLFSHGTTTGISPTFDDNSPMQDGKYIENGTVIIRKGNKKYYINGQEAK